MIAGMVWIFWGVVGYGGAKLMYPWVEQFLWECGSFEENYQGRKTPVGAGLVIYLTGLILSGVQGILGPWSIFPLLPWLLFGTSTAVLAGWLDDQHGVKAIKGLRGHFRVLWRQGKWTTGLFKVLFFATAASVIALTFSQNVWHWLLLTGLLMLSINTFNLLDVRPGRAIKAFLFTFVAVGVLSLENAWATAWMPYIGATLAVGWLELRERCMLGDTGANLLGLLIGMWIVVQQQPWLSAVFFFLFAGLHILAEISSISRFIERIRWLNWVDRWGRQN